MSREMIGPSDWSRSRVGERAELAGTLVNPLGDQGRAFNGRRSRIRPMEAATPDIGTLGENCLGHQARAWRAFMS